MLTEAPNASNRLYRGEVTDPREALALYVRQLERELNTPFYGWWKDEEMNGPDLGELFERGIQTGNSLLAQYNERVDVTEKALFAEWAASEDEEVRRIGEAALSGDFSSLAI